MKHWLLTWLVGVVMAQPALAQLKISDVQPCYGPRGPARKSFEAVAGDSLFVKYRVAGLQTDADGKVDLAIDLEIRTPAGAIAVKQQQMNRELLALGGGALPGTASVNFGPDILPGDYVLKVTLTDRLAKQSDSFERTVTCKKQEFAIAHLAFFMDKEGKLPGSTTTVLGQQLHFRFMTVGFDRTKGQLKQVMLVQTLDKQGRELMPQPVRVEAAVNDANVVATTPGVTFNGVLAPNRVGEFQLRFMVIDDISERKAEITVPLKVIAN